MESTVQCVHCHFVAMFMQVVIQFHCLRIDYIQRKIWWQVTHDTTYRWTKNLLTFPLLLFQDNLSPKTSILA